MAGTAESEVAESQRYSTSFFYFRPQEADGNLLIRTRGSDSKRAIGNGLGIT
jgi:hypothetical protein